MTTSNKKRIRGVDECYELENNKFIVLENYLKQHDYNCGFHALACIQHVSSTQKLMQACKNFLEDKLNEACIMFLYIYTAIHRAC
jgi:hypothetical protein